MPIRWPWESEKAYNKRLRAWVDVVEARQEGKTARTSERQGGKTDRTQAKADGGYYSPEAVAARQATVQYGIGAGLTAAEGVAQAFGYSVDLDGGASSGGGSRSSGTPTVVPASSSGGIGGMDQQTLLILAAVALGGVLLLGRK